MSLTEQTKTGLREMPSNAAWLLYRVLKPARPAATPAGSATARPRDRARGMTAAVIDAAPIGGDSIDIRMTRAQEAGERAREAEERAVEAAHEAAARSDQARQVTERGRVRLREVDRETSRHVKQRVAEAQKAADETVRRERHAAEAEAKERQQEVQAEVDAEAEAAQGEAEASHRRAEELVEDATEKLAEARRLADEAASAARAAAEEANRRAHQLAGEAEQQARDAEAQVKATERLREQSKTSAKQTARRLDRESENGGLESYSKADLVELAASLDIEGRTNMNKAELVDAIAKTSHSRR
jgi:colicin import membrane protein